jgi:hypothetical protein
LIDIDRMARSRGGSRGRFGVGGKSANSAKTPAENAEAEDCLPDRLREAVGGKMLLTPVEVALWNVPIVVNGLGAVDVTRQRSPRHYGKVTPFSIVRDGRPMPGRSSRQHTLGACPDDSFLPRRNVLGERRMKQISLFKRAVIALAAIGMMMPAPQVQGATAAPAKIVRTDASVLDIGLKSDGVFAGRVVDHTGTPSAKTEVTIRQGQQVVAKTTTDAEGRFAVKGLKGGVYEVASGKTAGTYRIWTETMAPPAAKEQALLVLGENGTRGQIGAMGGGVVLLAAAVIATLVVSIVTLDEVNDNDDEERRRIPRPTTP